jgi:hypothetical protein
MEKRKLFTLFYVVMIVVVIATCLFLVIYLQNTTTDALSCISDPITFYENTTGKMCFCNDGLGWLKG